MSNKELVKELRCLRMHLVGFVVDEKLKLIEQAERRLSNGAVSTDPETTSVIKAKRGNQGNRITKKQAYNQFLNK
jgi:hypothetical protein